MATITPRVLYKTLLREASHVNDYNFRTYSMRRVKAAFQKNRSLQGEDATAAIQEGEDQLKVLKRQVVLGRLYPSARSVME